jgi:two-component system response regulator DesR
MIRLLLADDEELLRGALCALLDLEDDLQVVAQAATTTDAVQLAERHRPDVAVLDLEMPPTDGLHAAGQILARTDGTPPRIIIVTRHARPAVLRRALAAGGCGRYVDPEIAASALTENECPLTDRELEVLREARTGGPVADIAAAVHLAPGTVRNYLSSAMSKLGVATRHAAAHRAWEEGWI